MRSAFAIALFFLSAGISFADPTPAVPWTPVLLNFTGSVRPDPEGWFFSEYKEGHYQAGALGVTYVYKCGGRAMGNFTSWPCGKMTLINQRVKGCSDSFQNPYSAQGHAKQCASYEDTGVTVFLPKGISSGVASQIAFSDACGWLGHQCESNFDNAMVFIIGPIGAMGTSLNFERDGFGVVKIYQNH